MENKAKHPLLINNNKGFSLLSVIVAISILAVIGVGFTNLMLATINNQSKIDRKGQALGQIELFKMALAKSDLCQKNLADLQVNIVAPEESTPVVVTKVSGLDASGNLNPSPLVDLESGQMIGLEEVSIKSIRKLCEAQREFVGNVIFSFSKEVNISDAIFPIYIMTDASGKITQCSTMMENIAGASCL